ncbi:MAG: DUF3429 domain-containing protein [Polynucleobacter sp.]|nr:DUF3429 domain-containing protein [Polynucleobacter sp.]MDZ4057353.1 DUF3429 domain-containing protein [Polynucleobacter sp.]
MQNANALPMIVRILGYAGLLPFIGLAIMVQTASTPFDFIAAESLASYGAVICSFLGAIHWGANLCRLHNAEIESLAKAGDVGGYRWFERNAWVWGVIPSLIAWLALHVYIPVGLFILAAVLLVQRGIDQNTYQYYFSSQLAHTAFMAMRTRLTAIASVCLAWAATVMLLTMT